jgi:hypothetical protein
LSQNSIFDTPRCSFYSLSILKYVFLSQALVGFDGQAFPLPAKDDRDLALEKVRLKDIASPVCKSGIFVTDYIL